MISLKNFFFQTVFILVHLGQSLDLYVNHSERKAEWGRGGK